MLELIKIFIAKECGLVGGYCLALSYLILSTVTLVLCLLANYLTKKYLINVVYRVIDKAQPKLSHVLRKHRIVKKAARVAPAILLYFVLQFEKVEMLKDFPVSFNLLYNLTLFYLLISFVLAFNSILNALEGFYNTFEIAKRRPIKSYLQIVKVAVLILLVILTFVKEPGTLLTSLAASSALVMILFRDSIVGFLASIQLSSYDMIRIGDWVDMPKFGVSGDVEEISLTTVKVRNFDKTVTTVPSHALVNEGVKNWRGMQESGGRRIKRSLKLDLDSLKFCTADILKSAGQLNLLKTTVEAEQGKLDSGSFGSVMTNAQLFRKYLDLYLKQRDDIYSNGKFTFLVRELESNEKGLPIELYVFTTTTNWVAYEAIQADIFDHLFAVLPLFELKPFQMITGTLGSKGL